MDTATPIREVIGSRVRALREEAGLRQEDLAAAAYALGLAWPRTVIWELERGEKSISAEELLLLPALLGAALNHPVTYADLLDTDEEVRLSKVVSARARDLPGVLAGTLTLTGPDTSGTRLSEADGDAARRLGISRSALTAIAMRLWGCSLSAHRDALITAALPPGTPARTVQAKRGHVTRGLLAEVAQNSTANEGGP